MSEMSPRERVFRTLRHQLPDRMPITLDVGAGPGISGPYLDIFRANTGSADPAEYFDYDIRPVAAPLTPSVEDFTIYHKTIPPGTIFDEFGVGRVPSMQFPMGLHLYPWKPFTTPKQMLDYPFPTFKIGEETLKQIRGLKSRGYVTSVIAGSINEWCYYLRSMEEFMADLTLRPEMAHILLDKVTDLSAQMGAQLAEADADIICFYGDVGGQRNLLMSPTMWRQWIKPRWKKIFDAVRRANGGATIFLHSCGHIEPIVPDFIEIGLDILNPIQPEAMDPIRVKHKYGDKLTLWGGIGLQSTMVKASQEAVCDDVRGLVLEWAKGSGAIVTVSNALPVDVPWPNVLTLIETVREFSREVYSLLD